MTITGLYIYIDGSDLEGISETIETSIQKWIQDKEYKVNVVNHLHERTPDLRQDDLTDWDLGININYEELAKLDEITDFLYDLAVKNKRDFAVGYYDEVSGVSEDIGFFGNECGKLKVSEIYEFLENNG